MLILGERVEGPRPLGRTQCCAGVYMKRFILSLLVMLSIGCETVSAQLSDRSPAFAAANVGGFLSGAPGFESFYGSRIALSFGASVGIPVARSVYVLVKVDHFSRSDVRISGLSRFIGIPLATPQMVTGSVDLAQWLINVGIMKALYAFDDIEIAADGGLTYARFTALHSPPAPGYSAPPSPVPNHSAVGIFAGIVGEHQIASSRWSIIAEAQYNQLWPITAPHIAGYGCVLLTAGVRFYLEVRSGP